MPERLEIRSRDRPSDFAPQLNLGMEIYMSTPPPGPLPKNKPPKPAPTPKPSPTPTDLPKNRPDIKKS